MTGKTRACDASAPAGIVLAGGKSARLGQDKADIVYSGTTLLGRAVELLRRHCDTVCVVGRNPALQHPENNDRTKYNNVSWLLDLVPGRGPAGGVATALQILQRPCLILSCDLPLMDDATLRCLLQGRAKRPEHSLMTTFRQVETGSIEALVAVYEFEALPQIEAAFSNDLCQLSKILPEPVRHHLPYRREEAIPFFNLNHPSDLSLLRTMKFSRMEIKSSP